MERWSRLSREVRVFGTSGIAAVLVSIGLQIAPLPGLYRYGHLLIGQPFSAWKCNASEYTAITHCRGPQNEDFYLARSEQELQRLIGMRSQSLSNIIGGPMVLPWAEATITRQGEYDLLQLPTEGFFAITEIKSGKSSIHQLETSIHAWHPYSMLIGFVGIFLLWLCRGFYKLDAISLNGSRS